MDSQSIKNLWVYIFEGLLAYTLCSNIMMFFWGQQQPQNLHKFEPLEINTHTSTYCTCIRAVR